MNSLSNELDIEISANNNLLYEKNELEIELENFKEYNIEYLNRIEQLKIKLNRYIEIENQRNKIEVENNKFISYKALRELELRQNPDENSTIISEIKTDEIVYLKASGFEYNYTKKDYPNEWLKVEFNNKVGWVIAKYYYTDILGNGQQKLKENLLIIQ